MLLNFFVDIYIYIYRNEHVRNITNINFVSIFIISVHVNVFTITKEVLRAKPKY